MRKHLLVLMLSFPFAVANASTPAAKQGHSADNQHYPEENCGPPGQAPCESQRKKPAVAGFGLFFLRR